VFEHPCRDRVLQTGELNIGLVHDDEYRQPQQPPQRILPHQAAIRVVGAGQEEQLEGARHFRSAGHLFTRCLFNNTLDSFAIHAEVRSAPDPRHRRARDPRIKAVHAEGRRAIHDGISGSQGEPAEQVDQLIRAVSRQDVLSRHTCIFRQRGAQFSLLRVGVDVEEGIRRKLLGDHSGRPVRILVGIQLDDFVRRSPQLPAEHLERQDRRVALHVRDMRPQQPGIRVSQRTTSNG